MYCPSANTACCPEWLDASGGIHARIYFPGSHTGQKRAANTRHRLQKSWEEFARCTPRGSETIKAIKTGLDPNNIMNRKLAMVDVTGQLAKRGWYRTLQQPLTYLLLMDYNRNCIQIIQQRASGPRVPSKERSSKGKQHSWQCCWGKTPAAAWEWAGSINEKDTTCNCHMSSQRMPAADHPNLPSSGGIRTPPAEGP